MRPHDPAPRMIFCRLPHLQGVCFFTPCPPRENRAAPPPQKRRAPPCGGAPSAVRRVRGGAFSPRKLIPLWARCARPGTSPQADPPVGSLRSPRPLPASRSPCGLAALAPGTSPQADPPAGSLRSPRPLPASPSLCGLAALALLPIPVVQNSQKWKQKSVTSSTHPQNVTVL